MNVDELQSVKSQERQSDTLQQLRASFYEDAGAYITDLRDRRDQAANEAADPFSSPEVQRLTDEIQTAERTVEDIYDRRVGKLVKMASFAAADMPTEDDGLTTREAQLFDRLVEAIEENRQAILAVLDGEDPSDLDDQSSAPKPDVGQSETAGGDTPADDVDVGVGAADLMGDPDEMAPAPKNDQERGHRTGESDHETGEASAREGSTSRTSDERPDSSDTAPSSRSDPEPDGGTATSHGVPQDGTPEPTGSGTGGGVEPTRAGAAETVTGTEAPEEEPTCERTTVRVTKDVGEILCVDERSYDLASDDVVTLPAANAEPLIRKDAAERLE